MGDEEDTKTSKNLLIQRYIDEYKEKEEEYDKANEDYKQKINQAIEKINSEDENKRDKKKVPNLINESNVKLSGILDELDEISQKIKNMQSYRDSHMMSETRNYLDYDKKTLKKLKKLKNEETISSHDKEQIEKNINNLITQRNFFKREVDNYNKSINNYSTKVIERRASELHIAVYFIIFIGILCLIARVQLTENVGTIEKFILIIGVSILLYHLIEYYY